MSIEKLKTRLGEERKKGGPRLSKLTEKLEEERAEGTTPEQEEDRRGIARKKIREKTLEELKKDRGTVEEIDAELPPEPPEYEEYEVKTEEEKTWAPPAKDEGVKYEREKRQRKAAQKEIREKTIKELRRELAEKEDEVLEIEPEQTIEEAPEESSGDKTMAEYLKHAIGSHPELLTPEIKKNVDLIRSKDAVIEKNEKIIDKNKDNAKAREKIKQAKTEIKEAEWVIKRAQEAINDYVADVIEEYNASVLQIDKTSDEYDKAQKKLFNKKYDNYDVKRGSIAKFLKDRKLKKKLNTAEYEEFEKLKLTYGDAFSRYGQLLKKHTKKYSRMEDALETGGVLRVGSRGVDRDRGHLA